MDKTKAMLERVDAIRTELTKRRPLTSGENQRLQDDFVVEYTYNSNAIEGNTLTLRETALALEGVTINNKPLKDHLEAVGHRDAFLYVLGIVDKPSPIGENDIKSIHALVLMDKPEDRGVYRRIPVQIMGAHVQPPQPYLVASLMEQLIAAQGEGQTHPIERAARFHLDFEGIHPFMDGNGRTGRLVLNLMLMRSDYLPIDVKYADRERYYDCFDGYARTGTIVPMVELVAGYVADRMAERLSAVGD